MIEIKIILTGRFKVEIIESIGSSVKQPEGPNYKIELVEAMLGDYFATGRLAFGNIEYLIRDNNVGALAREIESLVVDICREMGRDIGDSEELCVAVGKKLAEAVAIEKNRILRERR